MIKEDQIQIQIHKEQLQRLQEGVYIGMLNDVDKTHELVELSSLLESILLNSSIEKMFTSEDDFHYFIGPFSEDVIRNILSQGQVPGENGDDIAFHVLELYLQIFLQVMDNPTCEVLWSSISNIFDNTRNYYTDTRFTIHAIGNTKKLMTHKTFNETMLVRKDNPELFVKQGNEIDVLLTGKFWVRGIVTELHEDGFSVATSEVNSQIRLSYDSFEYSPKGIMTAKWEKLRELKEFDVIDCVGHNDRDWWLPATIIKKTTETVNGLPKVEVKVGFRIYPHMFPNWQEYQKFWPNIDLHKDSSGQDFIGLSETLDETLSLYSNQIEIFGNKIYEKKYMIDPVFDESYYLDTLMKFEDENGKKRYHVIGRKGTFSYYYSLILNFFGDKNGFEKIIDILAHKPSCKVAHVIIYIFSKVSRFFHKEYVVKLSNGLTGNIFKYILHMSINDMKMFKEETYTSIVNLINFYMDISDAKANKKQKFSLLVMLAIEMIKSHLESKSELGFNTIVDTFDLLTKDPNSTAMVMAYIQENSLLTSIFGKNSIKGIISKSKKLIGTLLNAELLRVEDIQIIWRATKECSSDAKSAIITLINDISSLLNPQLFMALLSEIYAMADENISENEINLLLELSAKGGNDAVVENIRFLTRLFLEKLKDDTDIINYLSSKLFSATTRLPDMKSYVLTTILDCLDNNQNVIRALKLLEKFITDVNFQNDAEANDILVNNNNLVNRFSSGFAKYLDIVKDLAKNSTEYIEKLPLGDHSTHSQNIRARLGFVSTLIDQNLWTIDTDPIDFVLAILFDNGIICENDMQEFYQWIRNIIEKSNVAFEREEKIFKLFTEKICVHPNSCKNFTSEAFKAYFKAFIDVNSHNSLLKYTAPTKEKPAMSIEVNIDPTQLMGFDILWKIAFESIDNGVTIQGLRIVAMMFANVTLVNPGMCKENSQYHLPIAKIIGVMKETLGVSCIEIAERRSIIRKCLQILQMLIEESEKFGNAGVISHKAIFRTRILSIQIESQLQLSEFQLKLYANTTLWDLKRIVGMKVNYCPDFLKIVIDKIPEVNALSDEDNGRSILELGISNNTKIKIFENKTILESIPRIDLIFNGVPHPKFIEIVNDWYSTFSTNNQMNKHDLMLFIQKVTESRDLISDEDARVNGYFQANDANHDGITERSEFVSFYVSSVLDRQRVIWENLRVMGYRHDLKQLNEPYYKYNEDKTVLPRYILANNEDYFKLIFSLHLIDEELAGESFKFVESLTTCPQIYNRIAESTDWDGIMNEKDLYLLRYSLQVIESFIEEIQLNDPSVDNHLLDNANANANANASDNCTGGRDCWVKKFIVNGGYSFLVKILLSKMEQLAYYINNSNSKENDYYSLLCSCIHLMLKIVERFYMTCLNNVELYRKSFSDYLNDKNFSLAQSQMSLSDSNKFLDILLSDGLHKVILQHLNENSTIDSLSLVLKLIQGNFTQHETLISTMFQFLSVLIPNSTEYSDLENSLISQQTLNDIILYGILSDNDSTRKLFATSVINMCKLLQLHNHSGLIKYIFERMFSIVENIIIICEKTNYKNPNELVEAFSYLMGLLSDDKTINCEEFLKKIIDALIKDIYDELPKTALKIEIFLGCFKILSTAMNVNEEIRMYVTNHTSDLIKGILTKVLSVNSLSKIKKNISLLDKVNLDWGIERVAMRNSNPLVHNACWEFILSMVNDSVENLRKFLDVDINININISIPDQEETHVIEKSECSSNSKRQEGYVGLDCLEKYSYMNSIMQQLYMIPTLRYFLLMLGNDQVAQNSNNLYHIHANLLHQIQKMFTVLELASTDVYYPYGMTHVFKDDNGRAITFSGPMKFLNALLTRLEEELKCTKGKYLVRSIFQGKIMSQNTCGNCRKTWNVYHDTNFLSLDILNMRTLTDCLKKFSSETEENKEIFCEGCQKKTKTSTLRLITSMPNIQVIQLQRHVDDYENFLSSRIEFPNVINFKQYCHEEYPRHSSYYEYHLVGVVVSSRVTGSSIKYKPLIFTERTGVDNEASWGENDGNSWIEFKDEKITRVKSERIKIYEGDLRGLDTAYILIYERKIKEPIMVPLQQEEIDEGKYERMISFADNEYSTVKKEYDGFRYIETEKYLEMKAKLFSSVFWNKGKNEYFKYIPFYLDQKFAPAQMYIDILEANFKAWRRDSITSTKFFDDIATALDKTIKNPINAKTADVIALMLIKFIINIQHKEDRKYLHESIAKLLIEHLTSYPESLGNVWAYIADNKEKLYETLVNANNIISTLNCQVIFNLVSLLYTNDKDKFCEASKQGSYDGGSANDNCMKAILFFIAEMVNISDKLRDKANQLFVMIANIAKLDQAMLKFMGKHEAIFTLVTFLASSSDIKEYLSFHPIVEVIYNIFCLSSWKHNENELFDLTQRDIQSITSDRFLNFLFKSDSAIYAAMLVKLSKADKAFSIKLIQDILMSLDQLNFYTSPADAAMLISSIRPLLALNDQYQQMRFEMLIGIPQFIMEDKVKSPFSIVGYHLMADRTSKIISYQPSWKMHCKTAAVLQKIIELQDNKKIIVKILIELLQSCLENKEMWMYLQNIPYEGIECKYFLDWCGTLTKENDRELRNSINLLKDILTGLNVKKQNEVSNTKFIGEFYIKDIKREEITLIEAKDDVYIFQEEYFGSYMIINNEYIDFTSSKAYIREYAGSTAEEEKSCKEAVENLIPEDTYVLQSEYKCHISEKEFYKMTLGLWKKYKRIIVENRYYVPNYESILKRFVVLNVSKKDARVELLWKREGFSEQPVNEYIPANGVCAMCGENTVNSLYVMSRLDLAREWTCKEMLSCHGFIDFI